MTYLRPYGSLNSHARWPGFDWDFYADASELSQRQSIREQVAELEQRHALSETRPVPFGTPVLVNKDASARLQAFCGAYHRLIKAIVANYQSDPRLQETITLPATIRPDALRDQSNIPNNISLCRIDFFVHGDGNFSVLETNANCPGGLLYAGSGAAYWRQQLADAAPAALPAEDPAWFGNWYLREAQALTGVKPREVAMLRKKNSNRLEFDEIASALWSHGVVATEMDPREITPGNVPNFGYLKLSIPEYSQMRPDLDTFVDAVFAGELFIQNGLLGRWVGDNKLCLAIVSDPKFADLFDAKDLAAVAPHIPWSRNIAQCSVAEIAHIQENPASYVLKRPLDTRGRGVIIGQEPKSHSDWKKAVAGAIKEGWLVMRHVEPTYIAPGPASPNTTRHDLALGLINGKIASGLVRSSPDYRVNVALNGRLHPLFMGS